MMTHSAELSAVLIVVYIYGCSCGCNGVGKCNICNCCCDSAYTLMTVQLSHLDFQFSILTDAFSSFILSFMICIFICLLSRRQFLLVFSIDVMTVDSQTWALIALRILLYWTLLHDIHPINTAALTKSYPLIRSKDGDLTQILVAAAFMVFIFVSMTSIVDIDFCTVVHIPILLLFLAVTGCIVLINNRYYSDKIITV